MCELKKAKCHRCGLFVRVVWSVPIVMRQYDIQKKRLPAPNLSFTIKWNTSHKNWKLSLPKRIWNSQKIMKKLKYWFLAQSLCIICVLTQFLGFFGSVQIVGFSYLLRLPGLRDCTGPHSSLPALGTAEGVLHTHTHNIHTSRFKGLKDWLVWG